MTTPADRYTLVTGIKATEREKHLANVMLEALIAADASFTEEEINRACGMVAGAIAVVIFKRTPQRIN